MKYLSLNDQQEQSDQVYALLHAAFAENEILPESYLRLPVQKGFGKTMAIYDEDTFVGFLMHIFDDKCAYIAYFAILPSLQNQGYGSQIIQYILKEECKNLKVFIDIEEVDEQYEDYPIRQRRKDFYLKNGFVDSGLSFVYRDVKYEVLSCPDKITRFEMERLWNLYR